APRGVRELERRWSVAEGELRRRLGREPAESDVRRFVGATDREAREVSAYRASSCVLSFEFLRNGEHGGPFQEMEKVLDRLTVDRILQALSPLERQIVRSIHLEGISTVELAARLGYSRRHITRLHRAAIDRLKVAAVGSAEERR
ncbi:MAG: sigma factor-like helix-turn-helix DNA-binding protein, partial [Candidatus Cybelea sp.]